VTLCAYQSSNDILDEVQGWLTALRTVRS